MRLKWIKLPCDFYFSPKLRLLGSCDRGGLHQLLYIYMLCLSGGSGGDGELALSSGRAYDSAMLSRIFDIDKDTVDEALSKMQELDLIEISDGSITLLDWADTQFIEESELMKEVRESEEEEEVELIIKKVPMSVNERVRKYRARLKERNANVTNVTENVTENVTNVTKDVTNVTKCVTKNVTSPKYLSLEKNKNNKKNKNISAIAEIKKEKEEKKEDSCEPSNEEFLFFEDDEEGNEIPFNRERSRVDVNNNESSITPEACMNERQSRVYNPSPPAAKGEMNNVYLTDEEYENIKREFPDDYSERIDELSLYMATSGKSYDSHYAAIKAFSKRRVPPDELRLGAGAKYASSGFIWGCEANQNGADFRYGCKPQKTKPRYGDFDPVQAMKDAIERSMMEDD